MKRITNKEIEYMAHEYLTSTSTIRELSNKYHLGHSTLHRYFKQVLKTFNLPLYHKVMKVAKHKKHEGQILGGKRRWEKIK